MPLYEYECDACGRRFELIQRFSDPPQETCTICGGGPVRKLISSAAIQFKGTGWYVTDYAAKDKAAKDRAGKDGNDQAKTSAEAGKDKPAASSGETSKTASTDSSSGTSSPGGSTTASSDKSS